jgi:hypothetical protein
VRCCQIGTAFVEQLNRPSICRVAVRIQLNFPAKSCHYTCAIGKLVEEKTGTNSKTMIFSKITYVFVEAHSFLINSPHFPAGVLNTTQKAWHIPHPHTELCYFSRRLLYPLSFHIHNFIDATPSIYFLLHYPTYLSLLKIYYSTVHILWHVHSFLGNELTNTYPGIRKWKM